jgi:hypothetical protein
MGGGELILSLEGEWEAVTSEVMRSCFPRELPDRREKQPCSYL